MHEKKGEGALKCSSLESKVIVSGIAIVCIEGEQKTTITWFLTGIKSNGMV
jgi:hypothetical protein